MPAPARITVPVKDATPVKPTSAAIASKAPASIPRHHSKARIIRRRARGRLDDTDTDEDLVREPRSDDDSDSLSSTLDTDSDTASESEPDPQPEQGQELAHDEAPEPERVPSPAPTPVVNGDASSSSPPPATSTSFLPTLDWSEMIADENANDIADLPVIDFADLPSQAADTAPPPAPAPAPVASPPPVTVHDEHLREQSVPRRRLGQSAREAYRNRLDADPAFVPTVGQFWSHDDRLLDKELRSLSGWWRGRWQNRGRGRGWGPPLRGRGGAFQPSLRADPQDMPPIERTWTHDRFEEMKKVEEETTETQNGRFRGRGGGAFVRGGFRGEIRRRRSRRGGGFVPSPRAPSESQNSASVAASTDILRFGSGTRPWFAMKPERVWTKQFDAYLYFDPPLKPVINQGLGQGVRVWLGPKSGEGVIVRLPLQAAGPPRPVLAQLEQLGERAIVVRLPNMSHADEEREQDARDVVPEDVTTGAPPPMDPVPNLSSPYFASDIQMFLPATPAAEQTPEAVPVASIIAESTAETVTLPEDLSAPAAASSSHFPQGDSMPLTSIPPPVPTFQPSPAPPPTFQPSQAYAYPLPPGIAVSESGVTYEIATGRAVFLQTPPSMPPQLYNPPPPPQIHPHAHFLAPHFGSPIFAPPRQSSRVEIRAPGDKGKERARTMTPGRMVNVHAEPFTPMGYYVGPGVEMDGFDEAQQRSHHQHHHHQAQQQMAYTAQYYYPPAAEYGYGQYAPAPEAYAAQLDASYPHQQQQQHTGYY